MMAVLMMRKFVGSDYRGGREGPIHDMLAFGQLFDSKRDSQDFVVLDLC